MDKLTADCSLAVCHSRAARMNTRRFDSVAETQLKIQQDG